MAIAMGAIPLSALAGQREASEPSSPVSIAADHEKGAWI